MSIGNSQLSPCQEKQNLNESGALHAQVRPLMDSKQGAEQRWSRYRKETLGDVLIQNKSLYALYFTFQCSWNRLAHDLRNRKQHRKKKIHMGDALIKKEKKS